MIWQSIIHPLLRTCNLHCNVMKFFAYRVWHRRENRLLSLVFFLAVRVPLQCHLTDPTSTESNQNITKEITGSVTIAKAHERSRTGMESNQLRVATLNLAITPAASPKQCAAAPLGPPHPRWPACPTAMKVVENTRSACLFACQSFDCDSGYYRCVVRTEGYSPTKKDSPPLR